MPRQVSAQRVQEAAWTFNGTPSGWRSGNGGERAGRSRECRNRCGGLKQSRRPPPLQQGPRRCRVRYLSACSVGSRRTDGGARQEACGANAAGRSSNRLSGSDGSFARIGLEVCLAVGRWAGGGGAIESWGVSAGETQPSSRSTSPFRTAQTTISCLLPNPSLSCMW